MKQVQKTVLCLAVILFSAAYGLSQSKPPAAVTKDTALRSDPALSAPVTTTIVKGSTVVIEAEISSEWLLVKAGIFRGYVLAKDIERGKTTVSDKPTKPGSCDFATASEIKNVSTLGVPDRDESDVLVSGILSSFNESVQSKDFSGFWANEIAERWRSKSEPGDFTKGFKEFLDKEVEISRIDGRRPEYSPCPYIDTKYDTDVLFLSGYYDTRPLPVRFSLEFIQEAQQWRLVFISVNTRRW